MSSLVDAGDILKQITFSIEADETAFRVFEVKSLTKMIG